MTETPHPTASAAPRATHRAPSTDGLGAAQLTARLHHDDRHRRRLMIRALTGEDVLMDLAEATTLRHGDRLALDDGRTLLIEAADEPVVDLFAADALALAKLAWHLGNRHTPTAVLADRLRIRPDHVLEDMAKRHGARVEHRTAPFDPEGGAYGGDAGHTHSHSHSHGHGHGHAHTSAQHHHGDPHG